MEKLDRLSAYFNERERRKLHSQQQKSSSAFPEMCEAEIRLSCMENNGYETPELNDKLYLHFRGFKRIENLDKYTGCKAIWLDSNGFDKIENLAALTELRCLYLSKNLIGKVEGLGMLQQLIILDLSNNRLSMLENLSCCSKLQTLNVSHNALASVESIAHLQECLALTTIDLSSNSLPASEALFTTMQAIPAMVSLSLNGNEATRLPTFRKRMIALLPKLGYLDRPVDERERLCAEAFAAGGAVAEEVARIAYKSALEAKRQQELASFRTWQEEQKVLRDTARASGRSLISEFTPEQQEVRRQEAAAASEAERRMLSLGVDQLAKRFWNLESSSSAHTEDLLDLATQQLLAEKQLQQTAEEVHEEVHEVEEGKAVEEAKEATVEEFEEPEQEAMELVDVPELQQELAQPATVVAEEEVLEAQHREAVERQQRVADSMDMYLCQLKSKPEPSRSSTWEATAYDKNAATVRPAQCNNILYWTEAMDLALAKQVVACAFDFEAISMAMQSLGAISSDACRQRWAQLDAQQWCQPAPGVTAQDTLFRVNLTDEYLALCKGLQPSYEALQALTAGRMPSYLQVPKAFPSTNDFDELD
jgi:hypothetical protein